MKKRFILVVLILAVAITGRAHAQAQGVRLTGVVLDQDGTPIVGAAIVAEAIASEANLKGSAKSKKGGRYAVFVMQVARAYRVTVTKEGYTDLVEDVNVGAAITEEQMRIKRNFTLRSDSVPAAAAQAGGAEQPTELVGNAAAIRHYNAGAVANNEGDHATAIERFRESIEVDAGFVAGHQALLGLYIQSSDFANALAVAEKFIEVEPTNAMALGARHDALLQLGRGQEADSALEAMLLSAPGPAAAVRLFNRGATTLREGGLEKAIPDLEKAVAMDPGLAVARSALATVYLTQKDYQKAADQATALNELKPNDAVGLSLLYDSYVGLGETEKAKETFAALQEISPEKAAQAFYNQGVAQLDQGKAADALASFEKVLASHPSHKKVHYMLGLAYLNTSKLDLAKTSLQKFLEVAPDDVDAASAKDMLAALN